MPLARVRIVKTNVLMLLVGGALGAALFVAALLGAARAAAALDSAQVYVVDRTDDVVVSACTGAPNDCSLRGALSNANANPGSTVLLAVNTAYPLTDSVRAELSISSSMTISVSGNACCALIKGGAGWNFRIVRVASGAKAEISNVFIQNGHGGTNGGGIRNEGNLTLISVTVRGNTAPNGAGIYTSNTLTLTNSTVFSNTSLGWAGGIFNEGGVLHLNSSLVNGNVAATVGGGVVSQQGFTTLNASRIITNMTTGVGAGMGVGGGLDNFNSQNGLIKGMMMLSNSQVLSNTGSGPGFGGGVFSEGVLTVTNTLVAGNSNYAGGGIDNNLGTLTISGGALNDNTSTNASGGGGGIRNDGNATLSGVTLNANHANAGGSGGGIESNSGLLTLNSVILSNNIAGGSGGGLIVGGLSAVVVLNSSSMLTNSAPYGGGAYNFGLVTLHDSAVNGNTGFQGGGLHNTNYGTFALLGSSSVSNNSTSGGAIGESRGGGIYNNGVLSLSSVVVGGNIAGNGAGGGAFNAISGTLTISSSTIMSNTSSQGGGGVANSGVLTATNSTLSGNNAAGDGGGISNTNRLSLYNVSLASNVADFDNDGNGDGGGLFNTGVANAANTLLAGNLDKGGQAHDCSGTLNSLGYNLIESAIGCSIGGTPTGNVIGQAANLGPLKNNGGPTLTRALLGGSPAINAGNIAGCADGNAVLLASDQRGSPRPVGLRCDIGAFEFQAFLYLPLILR